MVDPENPEEIANALDKLLYDTNLERTMIDRGLLRASKFTWARCAEKTFDLYKYVVEYQ